MPCVDSQRLTIRSYQTGDEVERCTQELRALEAAAETPLAARLTAGSVLTYFDFPEAVKVPCEQYLLYFVQFLKYLGVSATAELREEAGVCCSL